MLDLTKNVFETLRSDKEFVLYRGRNLDDASQILMLSLATANPGPIILRRLEHEYSLRGELDRAWAARPTAITRHRDRTVLVLEDPGGVPLEPAFVSLQRDRSASESHRRESVSAFGREGGGSELAFFLRVAIGLANAIDHLHRKGLIHKDIKPANVLVNSETGQCWLTGFGIASRLPRERQSPEPPEIIAGTLAYMAPEQTGRMNRSIDFRSEVVLNLVLNSIQAMSAALDGPRELQLTSETIAEIDSEGAEESRPTTPSAGSNPTEVLVTIKDSGSGLDPQSLDHLFDPFFSTKPQGLGIGLTISRSIIEAHNGQLWAKANAPRGAIFQFTLPLESVLE